MAPPPFPSCDGDGDYKFCLRAFDRQCDADGFGIPFFEFVWAHFFVDASYARNGFWDGAEGEEPRAAFTKNYDALLSEFYDADGVWKDLERTESAFDSAIAKWQSVASLLVPLARSAMAGAYALPPQFAACAVPTLPGYTEGERKLDK